MGKVVCNIGMCSVGALRAKSTPHRQSKPAAHKLFPALQVHLDHVMCVVALVQNSNNNVLN